MCNIHGKEVELVCKEDRKLVCMLCVATAHHGHAFQTINEYHTSQKEFIAKLLNDAKQRAEKLKEGAKIVTTEKEALMIRKQNLTTEVNTYFSKVLCCLTMSNIKLIYCSSYNNNNPYWQHGG